MEGVYFFATRRFFIKVPGLAANFMGGFKLGSHTSSRSRLSPKGRNSRIRSRLDDYGFPPSAIPLLIPARIDVHSLSRSFGGLCRVYT